jgi:hypothetical protein
MQFAENIQAKWQDEYCRIMTIPDPIRPKQPRREFKNYNGNFLNIHLTARTWSPYKHLGGRLRMIRLKQRYGSS